MKKFWVGTRERQENENFIILIFLTFNSVFILIHFMMFYYFEHFFFGVIAIIITTICNYFLLRDIVIEFYNITIRNPTIYMITNKRIFNMIPGFSNQTSLNKPHQYYKEINDTMIIDLKGLNHYEVQKKQKHWNIFFFLNKPNEIGSVLKEVDL